MQVGWHTKWSIWIWLENIYVFQFYITKSSFMYDIYRYIKGIFLIQHLHRFRTIFPVLSLDMHRNKTLQNPKCFVIHFAVRRCPPETRTPALGYLRSSDVFVALLRLACWCSKTDLIRPQWGVWPQDMFEVYFVYMMTYIYIYIYIYIYRYTCIHIRWSKITL